MNRYLFYIDILEFKVHVCRAKDGKVWMNVLDEFIVTALILFLLEFTAVEKTVITG